MPPEIRFSGGRLSVKIKDPISNTAENPARMMKINRHVENNKS